MKRWKDICIDLCWHVWEDSKFGKRCSVCGKYQHKMPHDNFGKQLRSDGNES